MDKKVVLFYGNKIPSFLLGVLLPLRRKALEDYRAWKFLYIYNRFALYQKFININLFWVVRRCDVDAIVACHTARNLGIPIVYEFDDRFDLLPPSDTYHTGVGLVAAFYWMMWASQKVKTYTPQSLQSLPKPIQDKSIIGRQYTPVFVDKESITHRWQKDVPIKIGILGQPNLATAATINEVIEKLKLKYSQKELRVYSFSRWVNSDVYLSPQSDIDKYYNKIKEQELHFCISIFDDGVERSGKTPNKFREAGGFGYVCVTNNKAVMGDIPEHLYVFGETKEALFDNIVSLIADRERAASLAVRAYEYCRERYQMSAVSYEITQVIEENMTCVARPFRFNTASRDVKFYLSDGLPSRLAFEIQKIFSYMGFSRVSDGKPYDIFVGSSREAHTVVSNFFLEVVEADNCIDLKLKKAVNLDDRITIFKSSTNSRFMFYVEIINVCLSLFSINHGVSNLDKLRSTVRIAKLVARRVFG